MRKWLLIVFTALIFNGVVSAKSAFSGGGYWSFDEGSGTVVGDSSGNGNHGTINGAVSWTEGKSGSALSFNGGSDRVLVPDAASLDITDQITIAAWIKPRAKATQYIVKKGRINKTNGYELSLSSAGKVFVRFNQRSSGDSFRVTSTSNYPTDGATWMHVAAIYDGLDIKLYINGVLETVQPATLFIGTNSNALSIGAQDDRISPFRGVVDEVHLYSIPLTLAQVQALVAVGQTPSPDTDGDGVPDAQDAFPNDPTEWQDTDGDGVGNNADLDDDNDGMPDTWEITYGLNPLAPADAAADNDGDGISNLNEYLQGTAPVPAGAAGIWPFDEGSGTVVRDSSGNNNHGTINGAVSWTGGKSGSALSFNGGSDRVLVPDAASLDITDQITIAAWIKPKSAATQYVIKKARPGSTDGYELSLSSAGKVFVRFNERSSGDAYKVISTSNYPTDGATWMHVAAIYDGLDIKLYINGVLETVQPATLFIGTNSNALSIGAQDDGYRPFRGVIDEVHLSSVPLTLAQVQALVAVGQTPVPNISVAPLSHNFGDVQAGSASAPAVITLSSSGTAGLHVSNMVLSDASNFILDVNGGSTPCGTTSPTVPAGQNCTVSVRFMPYSAGPFSSTLRVDSDDSDTPSASVSLSGNGIAAPVPNLSIAPPSHNFGDVQTGSASAAAVVTLSSSGTAGLHVSNMVLSDASNFTLDVNGGSTPCGTTSPTVPAGQNCTVSVRFMPYSAGPFSSTLRVDSDDSDTPSASVSLSGNGIAAPVPNLSIAPPSHNFGDVQTGSASAAAVVTLSSSGTAGLHVSNMVLSDASNFTLDVNGGSTPCGTTSPTVPAGQNCTVSVRFMPYSAGPFSSTLRVDSDDSDTPSASVSLSGNGIAAPVPNLSIAPPSHNFGDVQTGSASAAAVVTLSSSGTAGLHVSNMVLSDASNFTLDVNGGSTPCGTTSPTVPAGQNCTVSVRFMPYSAGPFSSTLRVDSDDSDTPSASVSLSGNGIAAPVPNLSIAPPSHNFGDVQTGSASAAAVVTLSSSGTAGLHVSNMVLSDASNFTLDVNGGSTPCGTTSPTVPAGQNCTVSVRFMPYSAGPFSSTLRVDSDDSDTPSASVSLSGNGIAAPVPTGAAGIWPFDEGSGTVVRDSSGNNNHGTINGAVSWTGGKSGSALSFNGGSDRVLVPDAASLDITDQITIAAWIKPKSAATQYVIKKARPGSTDGYELSLSSAGKVFVRFNERSSGDAYKVISTSNYPTDGATWMHVAAIYDGLDIKLYINGVLETVQPAILFIGTNSNALSIGAQDDGYRPFRGVIDEVHLSSVPLTLAQVQALVAVGQTPSPDTDGDGVPDAQDAFPNDPTEWQDTDGDGVGNNADLDDDNDGMPDTWEITYGLNPLAPADAAADNDGDGISNLNEYLQGTDPTGGFTTHWHKEVLNAVNINGSAAEKPQSKVWKYDGIWWGVFSNTSGTWLWRLNGFTWTNVMQLSTITGVRADTKLADNGIVHILLFNGSTTRIASLEYVPGSAMYNFWSVRPSVINLNLSGVESVTLDIDSTGVMWVEYDSASTIQVIYSQYPYSNWTNPAILLANNIDGADDIGAVTSLKNGRVGVMWSNQATRRFEFKYHIDGESPSSWSDMEIAFGDSPNIDLGPADDHINFATASDGTLYAAVKTGYNRSGYPVIGLLVRNPSGVWDPLYPVETNLSATRPIVILNELRGFLMVVYSDDQQGGNVVYRESALTNISFGSAKVLLSGNDFTDVSSAKHNFTNDIVIIASPPTSSSLISAEFVELTQ